MTEQKIALGESVAKKSATPKRKMRPGGGKAKGNGFEGSIAKKLSTALAPLNFMRSPGSGARVGGKNFEKFGEMFGDEALAIFVADVVPINEKKEGLKFLHSIECKAYKTPDSFTQLAAGTANMYKWFEESVEDAKKTDKNPLLIFKWNNTPIFVAVNLNHEKCTKIPSTPACFSLSYACDGQKLTKRLAVFYFDELVKESSFWFEKVL